MLPEGDLRSAGRRAFGVSCTAKCGSTAGSARGQHEAVTALPKGNLRSAEGDGVYRRYLVLRRSTFGILRRHGMEGFQRLAVDGAQEAVAIPGERAALAEEPADLVVNWPRRTPVGSMST